MKLVLFSILNLFSIIAFGQITFSEQPQIQTLMQRYQEMGKEQVDINGWRIKLVSTTDRRKMENTKYLFERSFPGYSPSSNYENPYYSLIVGAFETRYDLEPLLVQIKEVLPQAIPFRDQIIKSELFE